jgi:hypothetical protein
MKKTILLAMFSCLMFQAALINASFYRRWGANSYITNIPLFFKPAYYNQYNNGSCEGCENKVISTRTPKVQPKRIITKVQTAKLSEQVDTHAQIKIAPSQPHKNEKKHIKKLVNTKHQEMREKQAALEMERARVEQELVELEKKKSEFNLAKA